MTDRMALLEAQQGKPIKEIIEAALARHRGQPHQLELAARGLGVSDATLRQWCFRLGIAVTPTRTGG